jgi:hypothetical protein
MSIDNQAANGRLTSEGPFQPGNVDLAHLQHRLHDAVGLGRVRCFAT